MGFIAVFKLLKEYFQMYWLKPFDAVNDAANATALRKFDWSKSPMLEIGGGDGVFSFIMHGGAFNFLDDRYDQTDTAKNGDIYDVYKEENNLRVCKDASLRYDLGIDLKLSHLFKSRETGMYKYLVSSLPEALPVKSGYFGTVFLYTFHGLTDYEKTFKEIRKVIKEDGSLLLLVVNSTVKKVFICHRLHMFFKKLGFKRLSEYFLKLDAGRYSEIGGTFSKSLNEWETLLERSDFRIDKAYSQVSPFLWKIYDTQTRPFLRALIKFNMALKIMHLKKVFKALWFCIWFPVLAVSYYVSAKPKRVVKGKNIGNIFFAIESRPVTRI